MTKLPLNGPSVMQNNVIVDYRVGLYLCFNTLKSAFTETGDTASLQLDYVPLVRCAISSFLDTLMDLIFLFVLFLLNVTRKSLTQFL